MSMLIITQNRSYIEKNRMVIYEFNRDLLLLFQYFTRRIGLLLCSGLPEKSLRSAVYNANIKEIV